MTTTYEYDVPRWLSLPPSIAVARHPFSRMAPRKPDTQWVHFRCVQGQREVGRGDPTCPPSRASLSMRRALCPLRAPYGLSHGRVRKHREYMDLPFCRSLSTSQVYRYPLFPRFSPISTVSLITGANRAARVISAYVRTPLSRARSADSTREGLQDHFGIERIASASWIPSPSSSSAAIASKERRTRGELPHR